MSVDDQTMLGEEYTQFNLLILFVIHKTLGHVAKFNTLMYLLKLHYKKLSISNKTNPPNPDGSGGLIYVETQWKVIPDMKCLF